MLGAVGVTGVVLVIGVLVVVCVGSGSGSGAEDSTAGVADVVSSCDVSSTEPETICLLPLTFSVPSLETVTVGDIFSGLSNPS